MGYKAVLLESERKPAQSPELNTLDLGFNKSLDSRLPKVRDFNLHNFDAQVDQTYKDYPEDKLDNVFDMKSRVMQCIINSSPPGGNNFKLPHRSASG